MSADGQEILKIDQLGVEFEGHSATGLFGNRNVFRALDSVSLCLKRGEALGLIGESGSGKTTLGKAIMGLVPKTTGHIEIGGKTIEIRNSRDRLALARRAQMVFQDPYSSLHPRQTIGQTLSEPFRIHKSLPTGEIPNHISKLMQRVGLAPSQLSRYPQHFSGGQRQRIAIARAIANEPDIIIADEPVSALDVSVQAQVLNLLEDLRCERNMAMLFISHDLSVVRHLCQRIAVMYLGRVVETGPSKQIAKNPRHPYTAALISAAPRVHSVNRSKSKAIVLRGDIPSHSAIPPGCPFHTRCWLFEKKGKPSRCTSERPELTDLSGNRQSACFFPDEACVQSTSPD